MMRRFNVRVLLLSLLLLCSCSVKESRDGCPCWLDIDISECGRVSDVLLLKGWNDSEGVSLFGIRAGVDSYPDGVTATVPRGSITYCAYTPLSDNTLRGLQTCILSGYQSDPLWAYVATVSTAGETARDQVHLHKQYAQMTIGFDKGSGVDPRVTLLRIRSSTSGLDLRSLTPISGEFDYTAASRPDGLWSIRLPRQAAPEDLRMDIIVEGEAPYEIDLAAAIAGQGYDWSAEDLDDIWIGVDYGTSSVSLKVELWQVGESYHVIL